VTRRRRKTTVDAPSTLTVLKPYVSQQWPPLLVAAIATLVLAGADVASPLPLAYLIDHVLTVGGKGTGVDLSDFTSSDYHTIAYVGLAVLAIAAAEAIATYQSDLQLELAGERIIHELRLAIYAQLQRLSISFHARLATGDLVTRVTGDVNAIGDIFAGSLGALVSSSLIFLLMLGASLYIDPVLALCAFSVTPVLALLSFWFRKRARVSSKQMRSREGEIASISGEVLGAIREVQAFGSEEYEQARLEAKSAERWHAGIRASRLEGRFAGLVDFASEIGIALVLVVGAYRVHSGDLKLGLLTVMVMYAGKVYRPLSAIARQGSRISKALARADRVAEILAADDVLDDPPNGYNGGRATGEIQLDGVVFGYDRERPTVHGLSLLIPAGQRVAVIGRSGAGKSTLAALIARFYDPLEGKVLIDGRDLRECRLRWVRNQIGLVLQEGVLFTGTIADNIAYGVVAEPEQIVAAAKAAAAHEFIESLPDGYATVLGQRGVGLSGGQRQRIAIARTILRNPPILVLDEPTTGLDAESEAQVMDGLDVLMRGRTAIMITHSPALARTADRVIELEDGRIARQGTPQELAADLQSIRAAAAAGEPVTGSRVAPPRDAGLPQMSTLLDPDAMAEVLQRELGEDVRLSQVVVRYLRYKPRKSLVVHYDVTIGDGLFDAVATIAARRNVEAWAREPEYRRLAQMVNGRAPALSPLSYESELQALIQWLPLDISMPALAHDPLQLRTHLQGAGVQIASDGERLRLLAYKPGRRAVLRLDDHVIKIYAGAVEFAGAVAGLDGSSLLQGLRIPDREAVLPNMHLTCQSMLPGRPPSSAGDPAQAAGAALATLHRARIPDLRAFTHADQLRAAVGSVGSVTAVAPELEPRLKGLLRTLELTIPVESPLVPAHGDYHANQLLEIDGALALIDFDEMCTAAASLDLSSYAAHLVNGGEGDIAAASGALEGLVSGYGLRPHALAWYLSTSILRRSPFPFRYMEPNWPQRIERMVADAEEALHL
jgi:ATP-binding cassette, subfamily B, bacterial